MPLPTSTSERTGCEGAPQGSVPIDLVHLRRFTLGDHDLEMEVLGLFIEQAPLTIETMIQAGSDREWQRAAHTLKGSARAVGAWRIAELAERAELIGGISDRQACDRLLASLRGAADEARAHIVSLGNDG